MPIDVGQPASFTPSSSGINPTSSLAPVRRLASAKPAAAPASNPPASASPAESRPSLAAPVTSPSPRSGGGQFQALTAPLTAASSSLQVRLSQPSAQANSTPPQSPSTSPSPSPSPSNSPRLDLAVTPIQDSAGEATLAEDLAPRELVSATASRRGATSLQSGSTLARVISLSKSINAVEGGEVTSNVRRAREFDATGAVRRAQELLGKVDQRLDAVEKRSQSTSQSLAQGSEFVAREIRTNRRTAEASRERAEPTTPTKATSNPLEELNRRAERIRETVTQFTSSKREIQAQVALQPFLQREAAPGTGSALPGVSNRPVVASNAPVTGLALDLVS